MDDRQRRLWLVAGTGDGPPLACRLLDRGWCLRVSVVGAAAAAAYSPHPRLECRVGPLGEGAALAQRLAQWPCRWLIDASHPFAVRISRALDQGCAELGQPLLRLARPVLPPGSARVMADLQQLPPLLTPGDDLLLAIGQRHLAEALAHSPAGRHATRLLPTPASLAAALALGFPADRIALLRPGGDGTIERALCRRWQTTAILCRQSGSTAEAAWHGVSRALGLKLLLLARPDSDSGTPMLDLERLLDQVGEVPPPGE
ncbi:MAG: precorrin-6A/cobalt-precorrin-6A reductase [Prochlorococcaceae cyanobacterium]